MQLGDGRCRDAKQPSITQTSASSNRSLEKVLIAWAQTISPKVDDFIRSFQPINCLLLLSSPQALCRTPFPSCPRVGKPGCSPQCKPQELTGLPFPSPFLLHVLLWRAIFSDFLLLFNLAHQHVTSSSRVLGLGTKTRRKHWGVSWKLKKKKYIDECKFGNALMRLNRWRLYQRLFCHWYYCPCSYENDGATLQHMNTLPCRDST